jgi:hypothetical protein
LGDGGEELLFEPPSLVTPLHYFTRTRDDYAIERRVSFER